MVSAQFTIPGSTSGEGALLAALAGGPGSEFVNLLKREVPGYRAVIGQFIAAHELTSPRLDSLRKFRSGSRFTQGSTWTRWSALWLGRFC
jgi:hypothetical protein